MEKKVTALASFLCLLAVTALTFASLHMQVVIPVKIQNEKSAVDTNTQLADSVYLQTFNSYIYQAHKSNATQNSSRIDDSRKIQDDQTLNKNDSSVWPSPGETNQGQISELPIPLPDGRIFLGAEDPIPYIPTENPKIASRIPILPAEPGN